MYVLNSKQKLVRKKLETFIEFEFKINECTSNMKNSNITSYSRNKTLALNILKRDDAKPQTHNAEQSKIFWRHFALFLKTFSSM